MEFPTMGMEQPHVVLQPLFNQGHIKPMLCLAQLLCEAGLYITFIITHRTKKHLANLSAHTAQFPNIHFLSISYGFPDDHPRNVNSTFFLEIKEKTKPYFKQALLSLERKNENSLSPPVTCIVADGYVTYSLEVAKELRLPIFSLISHRASFLKAYYSIPMLIEQGQLHFPDDNMNHEIKCVPGLEGLLRRKNLPPVYLVKELLLSHMFQSHLNDILGMNRSSGLIINTLDELEVACLPHISTHFQKVYTVGPLLAFLNSKIGNDRSQLITSHAPLWKADQSCIEWLDSQPLRSVIYVSFGSMVKRSISELLEFWHGLVNSGHPFLWAIRPDVALEGEGENAVTPEEELEMGAKENGYVADWAPQEKVSAHSSVDGFLTHCGWNSILESVMARVLLICYPDRNDQNMNSQLLSKVLRIGIELEACDRSTIETTVKTLMGSQREEFQKSVDKIVRCARDGIGFGGSSSPNFEILVKDTKGIKQKSVEGKLHNTYTD